MTAKIHLVPCFIRTPPSDEQLAPLVEEGAGEDAVDVNITAFVRCATDNAQKFQKPWRIPIAPTCLTTAYLGEAGGGGEAAGRSMEERTWSSIRLADMAY